MEGTIFGFLLALFVGSHQGELPLCKDVQQTNPSVYRMQHDPERTGAPALKTCREEERKG